jgi:hypothetical protein
VRDTLVAHIVCLLYLIPFAPSSWLKRTDFGDSSAPRVLSDAKLEWMKQYSAHTGRWSLTLYAIDDAGVIRKLVRDVDPSHCGRLVSEYLQSTTVK